MSIVKTKKHELEYDTETKQGLFNRSRNKTAFNPKTDPFPSRLVMEKSSKVEPEEDTNTLEVGYEDEIENNTLDLKSNNVEIQDNKLIIN